MLQQRGQELACGYIQVLVLLLDSPGALLGSNMGKVTILPPERSMLLMVTFMAKMWNMGRTQRVVSPSSMNSMRGWFSWERGGISGVRR